MYKTRAIGGEFINAGVLNKMVRVTTTVSPDQKSSLEIGLGVPVAIRRTQPTAVLRVSVQLVRASESVSRRDHVYGHGSSSSREGARAAGRKTDFGLHSLKPLLGEVLVAGPFASFPLHTSVLKPHLHLSLCQVECDGYFVSTQARKVVVVAEFCLKFPDLVFGKRRPLFPWFRVQVEFVPLISAIA